MCAGRAGRQPDQLRLVCPGRPQPRVRAGGARSEGEAARAAAADGAAAGPCAACCQLHAYRTQGAACWHLQTALDPGAATPCAAAMLPNWVQPPVAQATCHTARRCSVPFSTLKASLNACLRARLPATSPASCLSCRACWACCASGCFWARHHAPPCPTLLPVCLPAFRRPPAGTWPAPASVPLSGS